MVRGALAAPPTARCRRPGTTAKQRRMQIPGLRGLWDDRPHWRLPRKIHAWYQEQLRKLFLPRGRNWKRKQAAWQQRSWKSRFSNGEPNKNILCVDYSRRQSESAFVDGKEHS